MQTIISTLWQFVIMMLLTALGFAVYQLMRQRGRILLRMNNLENRVAELDAKLLTLSPPDNHKRLPGQRPLRESKIEREGIKPGTIAPLFVLPEIRGGTLDLVTYRGKKTLLIFTSVNCLPCEILLRQINEFNHTHANNGLNILMVGRGGAIENKKKAESLKIDFPIGLQNNWEISRKYGIFSTPVGFLIDETGLISAGVAKGTNEIMILARQAVLN